MITRWSRRAIVALGAVAASSALADVGPTFRVNSYTTGVQEQPSVLRRPDGSYLVVWRSDGQDGDAGGLFARAIRGDGTEVVSEFRVNVTTAGDQRDPSAAVTPTGEFVVVWTSVAGASSQLVARAFDAGVQPRSQEIPLAEDVGPGSAGLDADGNLVVTYRAADASIVGARFDAGGAAVGEPVIVTTAGGDEPRPAVATMPTGEFVVVWHDQTYITPEPGSGGSYSRSSSVYVAPFDASAGALPQQSAWYQGNENFRPRAAAGGRDFVVVWSSCYSEPGEYQARPCEYQHTAAQTFAADGAPSGYSLKVSGREVGYNRIGPADVAVHDSGRFTVVWNGPTVNEAARGVIARQFAPGGNAASSDVLIAEEEILDDGRNLLGNVRVAGGPRNNALAVWERDGDILAAPVGPLDLLCTEERGCRWARPGEGRLRIRVATDDWPALLRWVWLGTGSTTTCLVDADLAPVSTASLEIDDASGQPSTYVRLDAPVCGAPPCWRNVTRRDVVYEDPTGSQDGIDLVRFRVGPRGRARLVVRAVGPNVPSFPLPLVMPVFVRFNGGPDMTPFRSFCSNARFEQATQNDGLGFLAVGASLPP